MGIDIYACVKDAEGREVTEDLESEQHSLSLTIGRNFPSAVFCELVGIADARGAMWVAARLREMFPEESHAQYAAEWLEHWASKSATFELSW